MLKNVTLGQFFPGDTLVHRLDPRTKIVFLMGYIVALFLAKNFVSYALIFLVLALAAYTARIKPKTLLSGLKPLLFIVVFTGLITFSTAPASRL